MPRDPQTRGEKAIAWVESWCTSPAGKPVRLGAEARAAIYIIYDGELPPAERAFTPQLAGYLTLLRLAGPPWARSRSADHLDVDIFSLWAGASPELRTHLRRRGEVIECPALGTLWSRAA